MSTSESNSCPNCGDMGRRVKATTPRSLLNDASEPVNHFETRNHKIYPPAGALPGLGGLIQAASGTMTRVGAPRTNRLGLAA